MSVNFIANIPKDIFSKIKDDEIHEACLKLFELCKNLTEIEKYGLKIDFYTDELFDKRTGEYQAEKKLLFKLWNLTLSKKLKAEKIDFNINVSVKQQKEIDNVDCIEKLKKYNYHKIKEINDVKIYVTLLHKVYKNLIFAEDIEKSIKTLSKKFANSSLEVNNHLVALDTKMIEICKEFDLNKNLSITCRKFQGATGIKTTLESKRKWVKSFCINKKMVECEPHTKIENIGNAHGYLYDRIYFNPLHTKNKILIGHIGKHL